MISSFFKSRKPKSFNFQARYYDADKEEFKERYNRIKAEMEGGARSTSSMRSGDFKSQWVGNKKTSHFEKKSNFRLLIIVVLLCALCYYILFL